MSHPIKHFITITKHRHKVIAHCAKAGILKRGLLHDLSKYMPSEFLYGAKYFSGAHSPNENERKEQGYSNAWMHHKGRNRHHFEYWTDYNAETRKMEPVKMPIVFVVEMFCDRVAAGKIYRGDKYTDSSPLEYFLSAKKTRIIHPDTSDLLEKLLVMLSEKGEKATFSYIKHELLKSKEYDKKAGVNNDL